MNEQEPIDVYVPSDPSDPRGEVRAPDGVRVHRGPPLHPDDQAIVNGIPCTSVSRTLIDLAVARVEWRPSLAVVDEIIAEYRAGQG